MLSRLPVAIVAMLALKAPALAETVTPQLSQAIPNLPGMSLRAVLVDYPPGGASRPHRHAPSAFIYARVLSGAVRSQVDAGPVRVYRAGDGWYEPPGAHHAVSENASNTAPAQLLAVFVVRTEDMPLTVPDGSSSP